MTPREKANVIYEKMYNEIPSFPDEGLLEHNSAKQCALIAVDEVLKSIVAKNDDERLAYELLGNKFYWNDVKHEIGNL
jgi:hypothetical protein